MATFTLRNNTYNIDDGSVVIKNYNETLDSATIKISNNTSEITIEPFDLCTYYDARIGTLYFCVDTYTRTQISINPNIYNYEISLFSQTKLLEGILLPSIAITPLQSGTKRTIAYYLNQYLQEYGNDNWQLSNSGNFVYSTKFNRDCPELQWNQPTLREVFTTLMQVCDCIPVLENNVIKWIDLTQTQQIASTSEINYITESRSSEDYCSEIKMQLQNVLQTSKPNVQNAVIHTGWRSFISDSTIMTTENYVLKTQYPILNIKHLWILYQINDPNDDSMLLNIQKDLCNTTINNTTINFVCEKKEWDTKDVKKTIQDIDVENWGSYQNTTLYFTRGTNEIIGFNRGVPAFLPSTSIDNRQFLDRLLNVLDSTRATPIGHNHTNCFFKIEYETNLDCVFKVSKTNKTTNERVIVDNQTNSWVDADTQANLEYQKVNRLGNASKLINARFTTNYNNLIKLGDKWNDDIVYKTEYQVYNDHIEVNAQATKDYVLRNYFTGIDSKIRTWVNAQNEAFIRHDLVKLYCELSQTEETMESAGIKKGFKYFTGTAESLIAKKLLDFLNNSSVKPINCVGIRTNTMGTASGSGYIVDCASKILNKSYVITASLDDNTIAGRGAKDISSIDFTSATGEPYVRFDLISWIKGEYGIPVGNYYYVNANSNYEFDNITLYLFDNYEKVSIGETSSKSISPDKLSELYELPKSNFSNYYMYFTIKYHKDNKEIPRISIQYEFNTNNDVKVYDKFIEYQKAIYTGADYLDEGTLNIAIEGHSSANVGVFTPDTTNYKKLRIVIDDGTQRTTRIEATRFAHLIENKTLQVFDKNNYNIIDFKIINFDILEINEKWYVAPYIYLNIKRSR